MKKLAVVCHRSPKLSFIFEAAQSAGIELVFICDDTEYLPVKLPGVISIWSLPVFDDPQMALDSFAAEVDERDIGGVMTVREEAIFWTALAAKRIGTPGIEPEVAALTRNKYKMRQAFVNAGLRSPQFCCVENPEDLWHIHALGFPLVVKPLSGWSSTGVMLARNPEELSSTVRAVWDIQNEDLIRFYNHDTAQGLVVEQYLSGKEFVVECFVDQDGIHIMAVGDKGRPEGPWFEETIYRQRQDMSDPLVVELCDMARAGVRALGISMGACHVELRLDAQQKPYVIEIGARIGGSGVSHFIVEQGTGVSFAKLCMFAALGLPTQKLPDVLPATKVAANYIIPLRGDGAFISFSGLDKVRQHSETARVVTFFEEGHISPPPPAFGGYPGFVFSLHTSDDAANNYHQWLNDVLGIFWGKLS